MYLQVDHVSCLDKTTDVEGGYKYRTIARRVYSSYLTECPAILFSSKRGSELSMSSGVSSSNSAVNMWWLAWKAPYKYGYVFSLNSNEGDPWAYFCLSLFFSSLLQESSKYRILTTLFPNSQNAKAHLSCPSPLKNLEKVREWTWGCPWRVRCKVSEHPPWLQPFCSSLYYFWDIHSNLARTSACFVLLQRFTRTVPKMSMLKGALVHHMFCTTDHIAMSF